MRLDANTRRSKRRPRVELLEARALLSAMSATVTTNQSVYQPGQPIQMTFTETNISNAPVKVVYGPSNDGFNVTENGNLIWQSNASANPLYLIYGTLKPGQSLTLHATWDGPDSQALASVLAGGTFTATNQLDPQGASATFQIAPALSTSVTTSQAVYQVGQSVDVTFVETNTSSSPIVVTPSGTFTITNIAAANVAVFSENIGQSAVLTLQPGQSATETASWTASQSGSYRVVYQSGPVATDGTFQVVQASAPTTPPVQNPATGTGGNGTTGQNPQPVTGGSGATGQNPEPVTGGSGTTGQNPQPVTGGSGGAVQNPQPVNATLTTNRQAYGSGQPVDITLSLKNTSSQTVVIAPSTAGDGFSAFSGSTIVWHTSAPRERSRRRHESCLLARASRSKQCGTPSRSRGDGERRSCPPIRTPS